MKMKDAKAKDILKLLASTMAGVGNQVRIRKKKKKT